LLLLLLLLLLEGHVVLQALRRGVPLLAPGLVLLLLLLRSLLELLDQILQRAMLVCHALHALACGDGALREVFPLLRG
jgi:hypothetical protein